MMGWDVQLRSSLGEDILLARHGARIPELVVDGGASVTVAHLDDGSIDVVPNLRLRIEPTPVELLILLVVPCLDSVKGMGRPEVVFWAGTLAAFLAGMVLIAVLLATGRAHDE